MPKPFEVTKELIAPVPAEDVWLALTTGQGMDGWFLGTGNEIEGRLGGRVHMSFDEGGSVDKTVTAWEPLKRFAFGDADDREGGASHAFEYTLEGREGGTTWIRLVHSGFLEDEGWEAEYDALNEGDFVYLHLLGEYARWFAGRKAAVVNAFHPAGSRDEAVARFDQAFGLTGRPSGQETVRAELDGVGTISGLVDFVSPSFLGIRTDDALLRFGHTPQGAVFVSHHLYGDVDRTAASTSWQAWLDRTFAGSAPAPEGAAS
jgi:uncharacterized protein YndB with AHSA1/START domain